MLVLSACSTSNGERGCRDQKTSGNTQVPGLAYKVKLQANERPYHKRKCRRHLRTDMTLALSTTEMGKKTHTCTCTHREAGMER